MSSRQSSSAVADPFDNTNNINTMTNLFKTLTPAGEGQCPDCVLEGKCEQCALFRYGGYIKHTPRCEKHTLSRQGNRSRNNGKRVAANTPLQSSLEYKQAEEHAQLNPTVVEYDEEGNPEEEDDDDACDVDDDELATEDSNDEHVNNVSAMTNLLLKDREPDQMWSIIALVQAKHEHALENIIAMADNQQIADLVAALFDPALVDHMKPILAGMSIKHAS